MLDFIGLIGAGLCVSMWGSTGLSFHMLPKTEGIFVQWVTCMSIFVTAAVLVLFSAPDYLFHFEYTAFLGGCAWALGNSFAVMIIDTIGFSIGVTLWSVLSSAVGFSCGFFGLLGLQKDTPSNPMMNASGAILTVIGAVIMSRVQSSPPPVPSSPKTKQFSSEFHSAFDALARAELGQIMIEEHNNNNNKHIESASSTASNSPTHSSESSSTISNIDEGGYQAWIATMSPLKKQIIGITLSVLAGLFFGVNSIPVLQLVQQEGAGGDPMHHMVSYTLGIASAASFIFLIYVIFYKKWEAPREAFWPSVIIGLMWAVGSAASFIANSRLSVVIGFPLTSTGPSIISNLWAVFHFKEIRGKKDLSVLTASYIVIFAGIALIIAGK